MKPIIHVKVLLVDDHQLFSDGVKMLLKEQPDFQVCGQVFREADVLPTILAQQPDLVLLDINLQGANGIDIGKKIIKDFPATKVVMLTMYNQPKLLEEVQKSGLHGYILKDNTASELLRGIRSVVNNKPYFDQRVLNLINPPDDPFGDDFARRLSLTFREVEIIRLIKKGLTNEEIGERLSISAFTVKTHRKNIHIKLGISKVTELVQFAIQHGL